MTRMLFGQAVDDGLDGIVDEGEGVHDGSIHLNTPGATFSMLSFE